MNGEGLFVSAMAFKNEPILNFDWHNVYMYLQIQYVVEKHFVFGMNLFLSVSMTIYISCQSDVFNEDIAWIWQIHD